MKKFIQLIDEDVVASMNNVRQSRQLSAMLVALYAPRLSWVKLVAPLIVSAVPLIFLHDPIKTYWMFGLLALTLVFFGLYFYRFALIRQRWLDKRQVDEFGSYIASPDDRYELPPS